MIVRNIYFFNVSTSPLWRHDIWPNKIQHNDVHLNDLQHNNDIQENNKKYYTPHNDTQW
jgi:hypothetical protein